ncbi:hypothetical protein CERSUDRAFT_92934 [Gelatoporia subvermispora B]|uniref:Uncharacterized protein n=1 Tax=Ceriporiopsis subvermispora (strain B) TaxID=914234 RepID=M2PQQ7_CERS8|nr:hypothetical protein CERSUDRAFT_92934 [Gelatoporia subvermispora B]
MARQLHFTPAATAALVHRRAELIDSGLYLADDNIRTLVCWARLPGSRGRAHQLVVKDADKSSTTEDDADAPSKSPNSADDDAADLTETPKIAEPAHLAIVARISEDKFYMISDANWRPSKYSPHFAEVKASCMLTAPPDTLNLRAFKSDWKVAFGNLLHLQNEIATKGFMEKCGLLSDGSLVKLKHKLFDKNDDGWNSGEEPAANTTPVSEDASTNTESNELESEFHIANWPCWTNEAKAAIEDLKETHTVIPIPVYDHCNRLVKPKQYRAVLQGATVEVHFTLRHWSIGYTASRGGSDSGSGGLDVYSADVFAIHVIRPPPPSTLSSLRKRKVSMKSPVTTPIKRRRVVVPVILSYLVNFLLGPFQLSSPVLSP